MTDFVIDIKTRLIMQAAEMGISKETAKLLAACIDETARDYAGERVYIGQPAAVAMEKTARNRAILRDWQAGERIALLVRRYGISKPRLYQIINSDSSSVLP